MSKFGYLHDEARRLGISPPLDSPTPKKPDTAKPVGDKISDPKKGKPTP